MSGLTVIQNVDVSNASQSSIIFDSIPQTFTDLWLVVSHRNTGNEGQARIAINDDAGSNYPKKWLVINNGAANHYSDSTNFPFWTQTSGTTANTFGSSSMYFVNYTGNTDKHMSTDSVTENNAASVYSLLGSMQWTNTNPITKITLTMAAFDFVQHSSATLYGITKGTSGGVTVS